MGGMGFRDLEVFNLVLLAKQGWHILQQPKSLVANVLKDKYFFFCDFMQASMGRNPSYAWRRIFKARGLLEKGLLWRVGNGETMRLWLYHWLPIYPFHPAVSEKRGLDTGALVSSLTNRNTGWWDLNMVNSLFPESVAAQICGLPLKSLAQLDRVVWKGTIHRCFSVRSAYYMEIVRREQEKGESSSAGKITVCGR
jgi:hypothetical protein